MKTSPFNRNGIRRVATVPHGELIRAMTLHVNQLFIATDSRVYRVAERRKGKYQLVPIEFVEMKE